MINKQVKLMIATLLVGISLLMVSSTATANVVNSQIETEVDSGTTTERCSATTKRGLNVQGLKKVKESVGNINKIPCISQKVCLDELSNYHKC